MPIEIQEGANTKNMSSSPLEIEPQRFVDGVHGYASPTLKSRYFTSSSRKKINRRRSIEENGRRMPWEVSNGDELFDEFIHSFDALISRAIRQLKEVVLLLSVRTFSHLLE